MPISNDYQDRLNDLHHAPDPHAPRFGPLECALLAVVLVLVGLSVWLGPVR